MVVPRREGSTSAADPERLGPYWLLDRIAEGRLGPVYRACLRRAGKPDKLLAITRISPALQRDPAFALRFDALIGEVANVVHPALCAIEDAGEQDGEHYVAAELLAGRDLAQIHGALTQRGQGIPPALVAHIANQIADGLAAAHRVTRGGQPAPLCHGELSLSDILIGYDGNVRLTGLGSNALRGFVPGLARRGYRAPELERGVACDARSDVYSLGACMYELLTGTYALRNDGHSDSAPLPRPQSNITRVVPRTLEPILRRALADDPNARFQTATELGRELRRWTLAQSSPGDARSLSAFLLTHFDAEREGDEIALRARLERVPADQTVSQPVPTDSGAGAPRRRPASRSETPGSSRVRNISPARAGQAAAPQSGPAPARAGARPGHDRFDDLTEHTPPRGQLMNELAATMSGVDSPLVANDIGSTSPAAEAPARLAWDDETPAHAWISVSEERAARRSASGANATPSKPAPATTASTAPTSRPPAPAVTSSRPPVAAPRGSAAPRPRVNTPTPTSQSASAPRPIAAPASSTPAPGPAPGVRKTPAARRKSTLPAIVMASIAVIAAIVAAVALLTPRDAGPALSTLQVSTHPAGAEVFVQGKRLGASPLRRDDIPAGRIRLELRKDGFEPLTRTIDLLPAQFFQLDVDLSSRKVEVHSAAIAPAPAQPAPAQTTASAEAEKNSEPRRNLRPSSSTGGDARRKHSDDQSARTTSTAESASDALAELDTERAAPASAEQPAAEPASTAADPSATAPAASPETETTPVAAAAPAPVTPSPAARPVAPAPAAAPKGVSRPATVIEQSSPRFPARATRIGISEGSVTLEYTVDRTGAVTQARVVQADPPGVFDDAALRAIEKWRYQPKLDGGKPVDARLRFTIKFRE